MRDHIEAELAPLDLVHRLSAVPRDGDAPLPALPRSSTAICWFISLSLRQEDPSPLESRSPPRDSPRFSLASLRTSGAKDSYYRIEEGRAGDRLHEESGSPRPPGPSPLSPSPPPRGAEDQDGRLLFSRPAPLDDPPRRPRSRPIPGIFQSSRTSLKGSFSSLITASTASSPELAVSARNLRGLEDQGASTAGRRPLSSAHEGRRIPTREEGQGPRASPSNAVPRPKPCGEGEGAAPAEFALDPDLPRPSAPRACGRWRGPVPRAAVLPRRRAVGPGKKGWKNPGELLLGHAYAAVRGTEKESLGLLADPSPGAVSSAPPLPSR